MKSFGLLALLAAAAVAASFRLWECPVCESVVRRLQPPRAAHEDLTECPACGDRGTVSAWTRGIRSSPDPRLRALFLDPPRTKNSLTATGITQSRFFQALSALLEREVDAPFDEAVFWGKARFVGEDVAVTVMRGDLSLAQVWLFDPGGGLRDRLEVAHRSDGARAFAVFEGQAMVRLMLMAEEGAADFTVKGRIPERHDLEADAVVPLRYRIVDGRFERLSP